jgi:MFS transporter, BCD family, chlorophyll transporter
MTDRSPAAATAGTLGWPGIVRLGLVQAALGAIVVLTTSTLNRVMVVELALPALLPGLLVALHYAVQVSRPAMGHGSDRSPRRTPWILGGMALLALGAVLAALATGWMASQRLAGVALATLAFVLIGLGVAASGTSLLTLLAQTVAPARRAAAATTVWMLMILGFVVCAGVAGRLLDPYSPARLLAVALGVAGCAMTLTVLALWGVERRCWQKVAARPLRADALAGGPAADAEAARQGPAHAPALSFRAALSEVWDDAAARRFTVFIFISMLAYSAQDLILEPFAGSVLGYSPGESTRLSGLQHGGTLLGMLLAAGAGSRWAGGAWGSLRSWTLGGCIAAALALGGLAAAGIVGTAWPFRFNVFLLGAATGAFSIAAIGSMMRLAGEGPADRAGIRMGLWGAAQAVAFAVGGVVGTGASDLARWLLADTGLAYACVFAAEAGLFLAAGRLAQRIDAPATAPRSSDPAAAAGSVPSADPWRGAAAAPLSPGADIKSAH